MHPVEFGGHLPITTVMWYFDTHLFHLKQDKTFKPVFVFIDHQPDLVCKIASVELVSCMYLLGVTSDNLSDRVNRVQTQLNHVLTQESKLHDLVIGTSKPTGQTVVFPYGFAMTRWVMRRCR